MLNDLQLEAGRCVALGPLSRACTRCADQCPSGAIQPGRPDAPLTGCSSCGLCVSACPEGAWRHPRLNVGWETTTEETLVGAQVAVVCDRSPNVRSVLPATVVSLPCASAITPAQLMSLALAGVEQVIVYWGDCPACQTVKAQTQLQANLELCRTIADLSDVETVFRQAEMPQTLSRRGLFFAFARRTNQLKSEIGRLMVAEQPSDTGWRQELSTTLKGASLRWDEAGSAPPRLIGKVAARADACDGCGACASLCPTGALHVEWEAPETYRLNLTPSLCTGCRRCEAVCHQNALEVSHEADLGQLSAIQPRLLARRTYSPCRLCGGGVGIKDGCCPSCHARSRMGSWMTEGQPPPKLAPRN